MPIFKVSLALARRIFIFIRMATYTLGYITSNFPDTLPMVVTTMTDFQLAGSRLGSNLDISSNISTITSYINQIESKTTTLAQIDGAIINQTPEYQNKNATSMFLSRIETVSTQTQSLQTQLDVVNANLENTNVKISGDITGIIFYTYTTATIILGILSIGLITYSVFLYMNESGTIDMKPVVGGRLRRS